MKNILDDHEGKPSSMRLLSVASLAIAGTLAIADAFGKADGDPTIILYFVLGAFAPKAVQRFAEKKKVQ